MMRDNFLCFFKAIRLRLPKPSPLNEGDWIIKGFIDIYRQIYTVSVDTKIVSKVLELPSVSDVRGFCQAAFAFALSSPLNKTSIPT